MTAAPPAALAPALAQAALVVAKSTLLLGAAAGVAGALRRGSAAARHLVWTLALGGLMALPALVLLLPDWKPELLAVLRPAEQVIGSGSAPAAGAPHPLLLALAATWAAGALFVFGRLAMGLRGVRRLARAAEPVTDPAWTELLERYAAAVGVRRPTVLLRSREAAMPLTWGAFRPAVLLPAEADGWTDERRRVVLLHELAHVARRDCLFQLLAEIACAFWWFHPGAWWAARKMRIEREQACDDLVLAAGARASEYAGHLLDVARAYRAPALAAAVAMARPSHLEGRVRAVLEATRDRRAVTARTAAICAGAVFLASVPLAAVAPSERAPQADAWHMSPARTWTWDPRGDAPVPDYRVTIERIPAPAPAVASTPPEPAARPASSPAPREDVARAKPARTQHHAAPRVRLAIGGATVTARVVGDRLQAQVTVPADVSVRVEGHGVRAVGAGGKLRLEANISALAAEISRSAAPRDSCPKARSAARRAKESAADARRVAMRQHQPDLGLRILGVASGGATETTDAAAGDDTGGA
jgi:beta-lactamase regulating signal transducer with metallopeptidase domain